MSHNKSGLTADECELARQHWDALMFAFSPSELDAARLALMDAPLAVQHAVMADITEHWLREYHPMRSENPFALRIGSVGDTALISDDVSPNMVEVNVWKPRHVSKQSVLWSQVTRPLQWLKQSLGLNNSSRYATTQLQRQ